MAALVLIAALATAGCGSKSSSVTGPGPGPGPGGSSPMTAVINGTPWAADPLTSAGAVHYSIPGYYFISGTRVTSASTAEFLTLILYNIATPGTYPLGMGPSGFGGTGQVGNQVNGWLTPLSGAAGTVTISTLTSSRIAGTFAFVADSGFGGASGQRTVTNGTFDFPISTSGTVPPLPDNAGSRVSATLGGVAWNAATVASLFAPSGPPILAISSANTSRYMSFSLTGVTAPDTVALQNFAPAVMLQVFDANGTPRYGGRSHIGPGSTLVSDDTGEIAITSFTATRVRGTFSARLAPAFGSTATDTLVVTNGSFDVGLP